MMCGVWLWLCDSYVCTSNIPVYLVRYNCYSVAGIVPAIIRYVAA